VGFSNVSRYVVASFLPVPSLFRSARLHSFFAACGALLVAMSLAGCGQGNFTADSPAPVTPVSPPVTPVPPPYSGPTFSVRVLSGVTPVVGSMVQLYAAGSGGNGSAATALLSAAVATDTTGTAAVPADYTCPSASTSVYVEATGGALPGSSSSNTNLALVAAIGPCSSVSPSTRIVVNEVTTVAAIYALSPFYSNGQIGASATNQTGLANAFLSSGDLANIATGSAAGTTLAANGVSVAARVNSIANALNACLALATQCGALYGQAPSGTPSSTLDAVGDLARYPGKNPAGIYQASLQSSVFSPTLSSAPLDWTMFVTYSGGGLSTPGTIAVDSKGSVWVANYFFTASKFTTQGVPVFADGITGYGLNNSFGLAIDTSDNVWIPNEMPFNAAGGIGSVTELTSAGAPLSGASGYIQGGFNFPTSVAIDPNGTVWTVDDGNAHLTLLNASGVPVSGSSGYTSGLFSFPLVVALDGNHNAWIANQGDATVTRVSPDGTQFMNVSCCDAPSGLAIDASNNVWVANYYGDSISLISSAGAVVSTGYTGGGQVDHPYGIALDGAGNLWVANYRAPYLTELAGASATAPGAPLSPITGLGGDAALIEAYSLAIDASGNIWTANAFTDTVTKFIGLAAPVKTPLSGLPRQP
jgi:streptogramin lyase